MTLKAFATACVAVVLTSIASGTTLADPFPPGAQAENVKQIGFSALGGRFGGFKIAIKHTADDKWYLYSGHSFNQGWSIVDVTDPANPRYVKFIPYETDDKSILTAQVTLHDNLMITSLNSFEPQKNPKPAVLLWDISDPENPKQVGSWMGGATGAHRNSYPGGKYAYLSTSYPGFKAHILVILDVSDPAHPKEVGKWWQPGQKDGEPASPYPEGFHGPVNVSPDGKMASFGYTPDVVNLDISDPSNPKLIGKLHITEPFASVGMQSVHTVLPLWDRKMLYVSSEAQKERCQDNGLNFAGMIDNADPAKPRLISIFPPPVPPAGRALQGFLRQGRPLRAAQYQPGNPQPGDPATRQADRRRLVQCRPSHLRHQRSPPAQGRRLFHAAGAARRAGAIRRARLAGRLERGTRRRRARQYFYERRQVGLVRAALYRQGTAIGARKLSGESSKDGTTPRGNARQRRVPFV